MEPRAIGSTDLFYSQGLSSITLAKVPRHVEGGRESQGERKELPGACRYPCQKCRKLLTCFGILDQSSEYDKNMEAANVNPT